MAGAMCNGLKVCARLLTATGMRIVPIGVDKLGNINIEELKAKAEEHKDK